MIFSDFVNHWLYSEDGYYANYREIGKDGDFYTSVSSSMFFGGTIAKEIIRVIEATGIVELNICEIGAHKGYLLADIVQFIYTLKPKLLDTLTFTIVERFPKLQIMQREYLTASFANSIKLNIINDVKENSSSHIFYISNEIFDAFSFNLYYKGKFAIVDENFSVEFNREMSSKYVDRYHIEKGEVPVGYSSFLQDVYNSSENIYFLTFDYGEKLPRDDFSVRIYKEHKSYPFFEEGLNIEKLYKNSDITFDVNFDYLIFLAKNIGFSNINYKHQSTALIDFGIMELLDIYRRNSDEKSYINELNKSMRLISPDFLGDRFKMLCLQKGAFNDSRSK